MQKRSLAYLPLAVSLFLSAASAQIQPHARHEGRLQPVVLYHGGNTCVVLDQGKKRGASVSDIEIRQAPRFGDGLAEVTNIVADLDPLRAASAKERAAPENVLFRYMADVTAQTDLKDCYALLTFAANGSIGSHLVQIGRLSAGRPKSLKVELRHRIDAVGSLHIFSQAEEIRSNQTPEAYDARAYFTSLVQNARGASAVALCKSEERFPHVLSDDGNTLATVRRRDTHNSLIIYDLAAMKLRLDVKIGDKGETARDLTWVSDDELAYVLLRERFSWEGDLKLLDINTGKTEQLYPRVTTLAGAMHGQSDTLVIRRLTWGEAWSALFNVRTRRTSNENPIDEGGTYYDDKGNERVRFEFDGAGLRFFYKPDPTKWWRRLDDDVKQAGVKFDVRGNDILDRLCDVHTVAPDGETLYISTRVNSDRFELAAFSMTRGEIVETVASDPDFDLSTGNDGLSRLLFRKKSSELIGMFHDAEKPRVLWFDAGFTQVQKLIDSSFPDHINAPIDWSVDGSTFIFLSYSDKDPGTYYVFRSLEGRLIPLLALGEHLNEATLAHTRSITFPARDGVSIPAYLTLPPEKGDSLLPLVVHIHGGPTARDSWGYDSMNQFLATRGYVVLQVNYRGSSGYGAAFQKTGLHARIDTVVLDDIADGVRHLIDTGIVDPKRIAVIGGSFGGWATYMSLIKYPELYRTGVAIAAISHWRKAVRDSRTRFDNRISESFWKSLLDREDFSRIESQIDPFLRAAELKQPIYIMHGELDRIVHPTEAKVMLDALKKTNPHVESKSFPTAGHSQWPFLARVTMLNEIGDFLRRTLPAPEQPPAQ